MLNRIELENFRCFENSKMSFRDLTVVVGKNNSGKSTIIEALRLISMATKKCTKTTYIDPPNYLGLPPIEKGFKLATEKLKIDLRCVVYFYKKDIAKITAYFDNNIRIIVYINEDGAFATIIDSTNNIITSKAGAKALNIKPISILPQLGLIKENEKKLIDSTINEDIDTYLSSRHFRNEILLYKNEYYNDFKKLAEDTWPGLRIRELVYNSIESEYISLLVEDAGFPAEIGLMGSGIQMWLQIIWFICRSKNSDTIILDEPDVYMHPELQVKILKLVQSLFNQVIIASHSIEIISNISPNNIVTIDKKNKKMHYANDLNVVQNIIDDIGSKYNLSLTKLATAKKCVFVEGEDIKILQQFYNILYPESLNSLDAIPYLPFGGFQRINETFCAAKLFYEQTQGCFKCYAILDRDYYTDDQLNIQMKKATENHLILHILKMKELENYIIKPSVLFRISNKKNETYSNFIKKYEKFINKFKDSVIDSYTTKIHEQDRSNTAGTAAKQAREYVDSNWTKLENKLSILPGKDLLRKTNSWIKENYGINCSMKKIFNNMQSEEIDEEIVDLINQLIS